MLSLTGKRLYNPVKFSIDEIRVTNKIYYSDGVDLHVVICVLHDEKQCIMNYYQ